MASALASLRNTELELAPRTLPAHVLAFGRGRLGQVVKDELIVHRLPALDKALRAPLGAKPAVIETAGGGLLALGHEGVVRLDPGRNAFHTYPRITLLPGSYVYGDRSTSERFFVLHPFAGSLFRYDFDGDAGGAALGPFFNLPEFDGGVFAVLKDATLLYSTAKGWRRLTSQFRHTPLRAAAEVRDVVRAVPAKRLDQVWLVLRDGRLLLAQLGAGLSVVQRVEASALAFDVDSNDEVLAVLELEQAPRQARHWRLAVYTHAGERKFAVDVPDERASGTTDEWVSAVTANKSVVLSRYEPWVAVGGPTWLRVWNVKDGTLVTPP
ncbi:MAG TPA: hypothetical protein VK524_01860 [Polyangiaceae bacterium]|nr:hypothetical protein [Polyangiaceae bacterium]